MVKETAPPAWHDSVLNRGDGILSSDKTFGAAFAAGAICAEILATSAPKRHHELLQLIEGLVARFAGTSYMVLVPVLIIRQATLKLAREAVLHDINKILCCDDEKASKTELICNIVNGDGVMFPDHADYILHAVLALNEPSVVNDDTIWFIAAVAKLEAMAKMRLTVNPDVWNMSRLVAVANQMPHPYVAEPSPEIVSAIEDKADDDRQVNGHPVAIEATDHGDGADLPDVHQIDGTTRPVGTNIQKAQQPALNQHGAD